MSLAEIKPGGDRAAQSALVPVTLITSFVLVILSFATSVTRDRDNQHAEMFESRLIEASLRAELQDYDARLNQMVAHASKSSEHLDPSNVRRGPFDRVYYVNAALEQAEPIDPPIDGERVFERLKPGLNQVFHTLRAQAALALRGGQDYPIIVPPEVTARNIAMSRQVFGSKGTAYATSFALLNGVEGVPALLGIKEIDAAFLDRVAHRANVTGLALRLKDEKDPNLATLRLHSLDQHSGLFLTWKPDRPGDPLRDQLMTLYVCFACLFAAFVAVHSRRMVKALETSEARAKRVAGHDLLSGLPNRLLFTQLIDAEIARCSRQGGGFAVLFLDLDKFKDINDNYGHEAGDKMIVAATQRISQVLRAGDRLARFGGDEFAILQTDVASPRDCESLARRILSAMSGPFNLGDAEVFAGISIGVAMSPQDAIERDELMRLADLALYRSKNEGRNRFSFFEPQMGEELRLRKTIEEELRIAIERDNLVNFYQPIYSADGRKLVGVEALVRWDHPVQGMIPPNSFISIAEDRGLIVPLGEWVLRRACTDAARWRGVRVAVNVSPVQFRQPDFVASVARILHETGLDPTRLELELTEGVIIEDAEIAENAIIELRAMGVRLALDDFGTGYSSLIYLRRFAFDKIKIDRSFLESMEETGESTILVHSIVHLGRALGLTVTAEGVETADQHRVLQAMGCHEMQGFYFSKPVPGLEIDAMSSKTGDAMRMVNAMKAISVHA